VAQVMRAHWALGLGSGLVVANPVPTEHAMAREVIDQATSQALAEAAAQGVSGKAITPFLLNRVNELTGGDSLVTNIALVKHNARLASAIAVAFANPQANV
jgi:pseudouridine-5'-phosphate glycosidase